MLTLLRLPRSASHIVGEWPQPAAESRILRRKATEAPPELEAFLAAQAKASGIEIVRDEPVELVCAGPDMETSRFFVFWPTGSERMHLLVPTHLAKGSPDRPAIV